jgi:hypothetical protein
MTKVFDIIGERKSPASADGIVYRVKCRYCGEEDWRRPDLMGPCEFCNRRADD